MNVLGIVKSWIKENGRDGLVNGDAECGCLLDDLEPCTEMSSYHCEPAYRRGATKDDDSDSEYVMQVEKPKDRKCQKCGGTGYFAGIELSCPLCNFGGEFRGI